jgi:hypothetical protein
LAYDPAPSQIYVVETTPKPWILALARATITIFHHRFPQEKKTPNYESNTLSLNYQEEEKRYWIFGFLCGGSLPLIIIHSPFSTPPKVARWLG